MKVYGLYRRFDSFGDMEIVEGIYSTQFLAMARLLEIERENGGALPDYWNLGAAIKEHEIDSLGAKPKLLYVQRGIGGGFWPEETIGA